MADLLIDGNVSVSLEALGGESDLSGLIGKEVKASVRPVQGKLTNVATLTIEGQSAQLCAVIAETNGNTTKAVVVLQSGLVLEEV